ncbi:hypothetical protein V6Z12_A03G011300 [Gossypium hirsutum]
MEECGVARVSERRGTRGVVACGRWEAKGGSGGRNRD